MRCLYLHPTDQQPDSIKKLKDESAIWSSFDNLNQAIDGLFEEKTEVISEREEFLLRELQAMLLEERLVGSSSEVLVVPARNAWPEYEEFHAYVCQPNRSFKSVKRIAFYCSGQIQPAVPQIIEKWESVRFDRGTQSGWLKELIDSLLAKAGREEGLSYKVIRLSAPDDSKTIKLEGPIKNNLKSGGGRSAAFTQNQRYVPLEKLKTARVTSQLVDERPEGS